MIETQTETAPSPFQIWSANQIRQAHQDVEYRHHVGTRPPTSSVRIDPDLYFQHRLRMLEIERLQTVTRRNQRLIAFQLVLLVVWCVLQGLTWAQRSGWTWPW